MVMGFGGVVAWDRDTVTVARVSRPPSHFHQRRPQQLPRANPCNDDAPQGTAFLGLVVGISS